jgi:hypothetical protein
MYVVNLSLALSNVSFSFLFRDASNMSWLMYRPDCVVIYLSIYSLRSAQSRLRTGPLLDIRQFRHDTLFNLTVLKFASYCYYLWSILAVACSINLDTF